MSISLETEIVDGVLSMHIYDIFTVNNCEINYNVDHLTKLSVLLVNYTYLLGNEI